MLISDLIVRSQMLTLSSLTALEHGEADSSYSLLCAHSFKEAHAADVTHTYAHTHQSRAQISSVEKIK